MDKGGVRSRWLGTAVWRDGGLWLPGRPRRRAADLLLRSDGAWLRRGDAVCCLSWADAARGDWSVVYEVSGRSGVGGTALSLPLPLDADTAAVWERTTLRNRLRRFAELPERRIIPLRSAFWAGRADRAERGTLAALCTLLAGDEQARTRLADPDIVAALIGEMAGGARAEVGERTGGRRTTFEILNTMRRLGYQHRNGGRPVPGWCADPDKVVDHVRRALAHNPYVVGLHFPEERIRAEVVREYIGVEPWPFAALTSPPPPAHP